MVAAYSIALVVGLVGLLWVILGGSLAENLDRPASDPARRIGVLGRSLIGAISGFGMGGLAAEFSPLGFSWRAALIVAIVGAVAGVAWVRYSSQQESS